MKTPQWTCANCGYEGGQLEEAGTWKGNVVCPACRRKLEAAAIDSLAQDKAAPSQGKRAKAGREVSVPVRPAPDRHDRSTFRARVAGIVAVVAVLLLAFGWNAYRREAEAQRKATRQQEEREQANAKVRELVGYAKGLLADGYLDGANSRIQQALTVEHATDFVPVRDLQMRIGEITDPQTIGTRMAILTDEEFNRFRSGGPAPQALYQGLAPGERKVFDAAARARIVEAAQAREVHRQARLVAEKARMEREKAEAEAALHRKHVEAYKQACSLFTSRRYDQMPALLAPVLASPDSDLSARARSLKAAADFQMKVAADLPLSGILKSNSTAIVDPLHVAVNKGILESVTIDAASRAHGDLAVCKAIHLYNPTPDKVKPDVQVLILNRDGVILFQHSESWVASTLDFHQSHTVAVDRAIAFPWSLVFSKWALVGWDVKPAYVLGVGSKVGYDRLRGELLQELKKVRATAPAGVDFPYRATDILPELQPFSFRRLIPIPNSQIVQSIMFSESNVSISYLNRSDMRIKPNILGYVLNQDGVIIGSFKDSWALSSLAPGEADVEKVSFSLAVPDELVFSRWAPVAYDDKPMWVLVAGSSEQLSELVQRTEARIQSLNAGFPQ